MSKLFEVLAGTSSDFFTVGDIEFMAAPLTIGEYGEFLALPTDQKGNILLDVRSEFYADKLRRRVRGKKVDPTAVTLEWVMDNLPVPYMNTLDYIFLHGKMPQEGGKENTKASPNRNESSGTPSGA